MAITYDETAVASHPGDITISPQKFLDYYNIKGLKRFYYLMLFKLPMEFLGKVMRNNSVVYEWIGRTEQFRFGCLNPSIVIDPERGLIATYTNLTNNGGMPTSVIKITSEKLYLIEGMKFIKGQKIPSVAMYYQSKEDPSATSWVDFDPRVPHCFSEDISLCNKLLDRLNKNNWLCVKIGLEQIQNKDEVGLYSVKIDPDIVNGTVE